MEYYLIIKGNKTLTHATTQMNLEISMMDEKNEYFLICFLLFFGPSPQTNLCASRCEKLT